MQPTNNPRSVAKRRSTGTLSTALLICGATLFAATAAPLPAQAKQKQGQSADKLGKWPALKKAVSDRARSVARQFKKPQEKLHEEAHKKLVEIGAGVAPVLIPMVSDRPQNTNDHLFAVLDAVVDKSHASLLARETKRPSVEWRRWLMRKLAGFGDKDMAAVFKPALKDKDKDIAFYAGLGMLALGKHDGLDVVLLAAKQRWAELGDITAKALTPARAAKNALPVFEKIAQARATDQMAGLRLLRYLMVKEQGMMLRTYLQSSDFAVKKEAINTARVLHGEKPLDKLSSFQAINQAKQWLQKL